MKIRTILLMAGIAAGAVYLLRKSGTSQPPSAATQAPESTAQAPISAEPVVHMVEETLHQHEGEDNPAIHAFEEAVSHTHQGA